MSTQTPTALHYDLVSCHQCSRLEKKEQKRCSLCHSPLHARKYESMQQTLALLVTACVLYIPANTYPIMYTTQFGASEASTILSGVITLIEVGSAPIAIVIFLFSIIVPTGKIMALFYLMWTVERHSILDPRQRSLMYRVTEFIGKWSMVDVFVVAILAALVHLGELMAVKPGVAAISFAGVVISTMLAALRFDPRLIWDNVDSLDEQQLEEIGGNSTA